MVSSRALFSGTTGDDPMRFLFGAALLASTCCSAAFAAEFSPASKIDAVTVFPQGADVVRDIEIDLPMGEHSIVLKDLPQTIDAQSVRVTGDASGNLLIGSVDTRNKFQGDGNDAKRKVLEDEIKDLTFERGALDQTVSDLNSQRNILMSLADKQLVPQTTTETVKAIDAQQLGSLLDLVGSKLSVISKDALTAQKRQRDIDDRIGVLNAQIAELSPEEEYQTEVVLNVEAKDALKTVLHLSYRVQEASWVPFYDARLSLGDGKSKPGIELVSRAEVTQNTGEKWDSVALTLSTARPNGSTAAPELVAFEVSKIEAVQVSGAVIAAEQTVAVEESEADGGTKWTKKVGKQDARLRTLVLAKPAAVAQQQANVLNVGFQATYEIGGRVSVDNAGQSKKVRMTSSQQEASLQAITVPRLDPAAYLTATFKVAGSGPQLPGVVNLFRDGVFVGQGNLPLLNPTEEARLGFGVDDLVKVTRNEVKRLSGEEGIISTSNVDERSWDITVKNLHDIAIPVRVTDRVPFTASQDITISEMPGMTAPTVRDVEKQRGVMAWDFTLEPKSENTLKTGYKITWPEGLTVSAVE
jgi:uncharacterized protein (TIGR02231 family)